MSLSKHGLRLTRPFDRLRATRWSRRYFQVRLLRLQAKKKLTIDQTAKQWLLRYPAWKNVTIGQKLNMTSGIPTYGDESSMLSAYAANPMRDWTRSQLLALVMKAL
jgi:D-alanyl-D-alanine carboxypeptidase